jgi:hypothetical protein
VIICPTNNGIPGFVNGGSQRSIFGARTVCRTQRKRKGTVKMKTKRYVVILDAEPDSTSDKMLAAALPVSPRLAGTSHASRGMSDQSNTLLKCALHNKSAVISIIRMPSAPTLSLDTECYITEYTPS